MAFEMETFTSTPDIRMVSPVHARIVNALRYTHVARASRSYCHDTLARSLGNAGAAWGFHVFLDEVFRAWPDPIALNPPCQPRFSYDEMLLVDLSTAAARNDRASFDKFCEDMIGKSGRNAIWHAARRYMRYLVALVE
ncbi:MAG: hypothetical protein ACK5NN_02390 [Sphingomonadaceae bacterium]